MARTTAEALDHLRALLTDAATGMNAQLGGIESRDGVILERLSDQHFALRNMPADLADQTREAGYPSVFLFAEQAENLNREKFAFFSGPLLLGAEMRITADRSDRLEADLHRYVEALLNVLQASRGEWTDGLVYSGRYAVTFAPSRLGGENFLQSARVSIPLEQYVNV